jgi:hypothetical protein
MAIEHQKMGIDRSWQPEIGIDRSWRSIAFWALERTLDAKTLLNDLFLSESSFQRT